MVEVITHPHKGLFDRFDVTCFLNGKRIRKEVNISANRVRSIKGFYDKFINHKY